MKPPSSTPGERPVRTNGPTMPPDLDRLYVGIDVAQESFVAAVVDARGNVVRASKSYANTPEGMEKLREDVEPLGTRLGVPLAYAMEASGCYHIDLLYFLLEKKAQAWAFNPLLLEGEKRAQIRKTKTDAIDALRIAQFARKEGRAHPFATWNPEDRRLRERCRVRYRLVDKATPCKQQLHRNLDLLVPGLSSLFDDLGSPSVIAAIKTIFQLTKFPQVHREELEEAMRPYYARRGLLTTKVVEICRRLEACHPPEGLVEPLIDETKFLVHLLELLQEQICQEEEKIAKEMARRESLLFTIPGLGPITAAVVESEMGDAHRFPDAEAVTAFAGLDPRVRQSGKFRGTETPISKRGSPLLREALYLAAFTSIQRNPVAKAIYERLTGRGKAKRSALVAVSRHILIWAWAVKRDGVPYRMAQGGPGRTLGKSPTPS